MLEFESFDCFGFLCKIVSAIQTSLNPCNLMKREEDLALATKHPYMYLVQSLPDFNPIYTDTHFTCLAPLV